MASRNFAIGYEFGSRRPVWRTLLGYDSTSTGHRDAQKFPATYRRPQLDVRTPRLCDCRRLESLLRLDRKLVQQLGPPTEPPRRQNARQFREDTQAWCERINGLSLAIVHHEESCIGLITLGQVDNDKRAARIGYWLGSDHWGKGYASEAFALTLWLAREIGIHTVSATIARHNLDSLYLWLHYQAVTVDLPDGRIRCVLEICGQHGSDIDAAIAAIQPIKAKLRLGRLRCGNG